MWLLKLKTFSSKGFAGLTFLAVFLFSLSNMAQAALKEPDINDPEIAAALEETENYFRALTTMKARFIQANPDGSYLEGDLYLNRPGKMRFEYDDPVPILLVADGLFFIHVDKQLQEVMHIPLVSTPANLLLSSEFSIEDGLTLIGYERTNGILRLQFTQTEEPELGSMILTFTEGPMQLKQWSVIDAQQNQTTVTIIAPQYGGDLAADLFYFVNPWTKGKGDN